MSGERDTRPRPPGGAREQEDAREQWTSARLRALADLMGHFPRPPDFTYEEAAAALRDFAAVVAVLCYEGVDIGRPAVPHAVAWAECWRPGGMPTKVLRDTPLAAVLALASQIEGGEGTA